jgi:hypothetical protein
LFFLPLAIVHDPVDHFLPPTVACQQLQMWLMQQQLLIDLPVHHHHITLDINTKESVPQKQEKV